MFACCKKLKNIDLSYFEINKEIISFRDSEFDLSPFVLKFLFPNSTNMSFMFKECENLTNLTINKETYEFLKGNEIFPNKVNLTFK